MHPRTSPLASEPQAGPDEQSTDPAPNRAARRGRRTGTEPASGHGRGAAPHARGAQGRRINPVRRTG